jgi:hypothetical protein
MVTDLDPHKIMAEHRLHAGSKDGEQCFPATRSDELPCLPYRLAAENAALRAAIGRVEALCDEHDRLRHDFGLPGGQPVNPYRAALALPEGEQ